MEGILDACMREGLVALDERDMAVSITAGATALMRTPCLAKSTALVLVSDTIAPLLAM